MNNRRQQRGASSLTILFYLLVGAFTLTCILKLLPLYIDGYTADKAFKTAVEDREFDGMSTGQIKRKISKMFEVNMIKGIKARDVMVERKKGRTIIDASFEHRVSLFFNIDVVVKFDKLIYDYKTDLDS